jgi:hypothetical protein
MKTSAIVLLCLPLVACGTSSTNPQSGTGSTSGAGGSGSGSQVSGSASGASPSGASGSSLTGATSGGTGSGAVGSGATSGITSGSSSGAPSGTYSGSASGSTSGAVSGSASGSASGASSGGVNLDAGLPDGAVNMVPAGYTGTPFTTITIPGFLYLADYDKGGPNVAYCHNGAATTVAGCAAGIKLSDWCCSACNAAGTDARCDAHTVAGCPNVVPPATMGGLATCPLFRPDNDNAGLSHMNLGEVDTYAAAGPTWIPGPNGPTLTGPMVTVGTPVPQHASATTEEDTYIGYMYTSEWSKYTVEVLAAGKYSIGGLAGVPAGTQITLDFGNGITTGMVTLPTSPVTAACKCIEAYHAWNNFADAATVTFPAPGTYVMTFTLNTLQFNPLFFTFTKM